MVDLFIAFESSSRKALSQIEAKWPDLGPEKTAFWSCEEAHKGGRVLYYVGGKLDVFVGHSTYVTNWSIGRSGSWKGAELIRHGRVTRFIEFVSGAEVQRETGFKAPRDAGQVPSNLATAVWRAAKGLPSTAVEKRLEGMMTESKSKFRDPALRSAALALAKGRCAICDKNFAKVAGGLGLKSLVVHHKKQLKDTDQPIETRVTDLAVVCANHHMMIHANREKALTLGQLRKKLGK